MLLFSLSFFCLVNLSVSDPFIKFFLKKFYRKQKRIVTMNNRPNPIANPQERPPSLNQLQEFADGTEQVK